MESQYYWQSARPVFLIAGEFHFVKFLGSHSAANTYIDGAVSKTINANLHCS
jgi:ribonucleotide reductase alpha subunit